MSLPGCRTFVEFNMASKRRSFGGVQVEEVAVRDAAALTIPRRANYFYFSDAPAADLNEQRDLSNRYVIAKKLLTREEAVRLDPKEAHTAGKSTQREHGRMTTDFEIAAAIWEVKYDAKHTFALLRNGGIAQLRDDDIVVDAKGREMFRMTGAKPPAPPAPAFNPALKRDLNPMKPPRFKPRQG